MHLCFARGPHSKNRRPSRILCGCVARTPWLVRVAPVRFGWLGLCMERFEHFRFSVLGESSRGNTIRGNRTESL